MKSTSLKMTIILGLAICGCIAMVKPEAKPAHLLAAEQIVAGILPADNDYVHRGCYLHFKGVDGAEKFENHTDCSDFFNLLTQHVYGFTDAQFKQWTHHTRPVAANWYETVTESRAPDLFKPIPHLADAEPGDMIFIKYPAGGEDTGHVMMIAGVPHQRSATAPIQPDTQQWEVAVIDSSKSGHGPTDTRHNADGTFGRGVGKGILRVYTDSAGAPAGYSWSVLSVSKFIPVTEHRMVLARLTPPNM